MGSRKKSGDEAREQLVAFLREHKREHKYLPTIAVMARELGMARNTVTWHLEMLKQSKRVDFEDGNMSRSLRLR